MQEVIYISGPISGRPNGNREAFDQAQRELEADGHRVLNPHVFCAFLESSPRWPSMGPLEKWDAYMAVCLATLPGAHRIHLLEGWEDSPGARIEEAKAQKLGLRFSYHSQGCPSCGRPGTRVFSCPECSGVPVVGWKSGGEIGKAAEAKYRELAHKGWEWSSFYNGFLEGAADPRNRTTLAPKSDAVREAVGAVGTKVADEFSRWVSNNPGSPSFISDRSRKVLSDMIKTQALALLSGEVRS